MHVCEQLVIVVYIDVADGIKDKHHEKARYQKEKAKRKERRDLLKLMRHAKEEMFTQSKQEVFPLLIVTISKCLTGFVYSLIGLPLKDLKSISKHQN